VAQVNGTSLSETEFHKLCETATQMQPQIPVGHQVLARWIQNTILAQEAKRLKVYPSDKDLDARMRSMEKQAEYAGLKLDDVLKQRGVSREIFKDEQLRDLIRERVITQGVQVTDAQVKAFFDTQKPNLIQPERIQLSQITLDSPDQVQKAKDDLGSGDFANVAATRSKDAFAQSGGRVPMDVPRAVPAGGPVDQKVVDAAYKLKEGEVSAPVKVGANWVIARLEKKFEKKEPKLEDFEEFFRSQLMQQEAAKGKAQQVQAQLMELTRNASLTINRPEYKQLETELKAMIPRVPEGGPGGIDPSQMPPPMPGG
jgi:foldase protein PrsA